MTRPMPRCDASDELSDRTRLATAHPPHLPKFSSSQRSESEGLTVNGAPRSGLTASGTDAQ
jgi:hypothetical protein